MKSNRVLSISLGIVLLLLGFLIYFLILPTAHEIFEGMKAYETRVAYRDDYKLHTTPLPQSVVEDICLKLNLKATSENCKSDRVVYAPDFFEEIKVYFSELPNQNKTQTLVQDKLGNYLVYCENPDSEGSYVCHYDLRGDSIYPIAFFFDKHGTYYRVIASIGGS